MKETALNLDETSVRAVLDHGRTQLRVPYGALHFDGRACPLGGAGDRLWIRESFLRFDREAGIVLYRAGGWNRNPGPFHMLGPRWQPAGHMQRGESRITLEIVATRGERLHDATDADVLAEGVRESWLHGFEGTLYIREGGKFAPADYLPRPKREQWTKPFTPAEARRAEFAARWDRQHARVAPWSGNPLVWVVEFKRVEQGR